MVDVTGVSKGKGFAGTIKRHNFRRGPETHGSDSHRQPGSIGAGTYPGKVFKGTPHGRPHGQRPGHRQEADRRPHRRRAQPAARQGHRARRAATRWSWSGRPSRCPATTLFSKTGARARHGRPARDAVRGEVNEAVMHQAVTAQLAGRRTGTARHQDARRGPRRRRQAVPPEGHRPRPPGLAPRAALRRRRRGLRPAPAQLRAAPAQAHEARSPCRAR